MVSTLRSITALSLPCLLAAPIHAQVTFERIGMGGEPYPGRPGSLYAVNPDQTFIGPRSLDSQGNVYFNASYDNDGNGDVLVYRPSSEVVEPFVRDNFSLRDMPATVFWGVVGGPTPGMIAHVPLIDDPVLGPRLAVAVSRADGSHEVEGVELDQPPGYDQEASWFEVGISGGAALDVGMNRYGSVTFGAAYYDQQSVVQNGCYLTAAGGLPARIIDSTMPVPGHPGATWIPYEGWLSPFEPQGAGIDDAGNAYFRAKYQTVDGKACRAFYRRSTDGAILAIADGGSNEPIPGRPPGYHYGAIKTGMNNRLGDSGYSAEVIDDAGIFWGTGVYITRAGGMISKLVDSGDPVPGIPDAIGHVPYLADMSDSGYVAVADNHGLLTPDGKVYAYSLSLYSPEGVKLILRFDQLPGLPGLRATILLGIAVNERGDIVFNAKLSTPDEQYVTFAYLNDTGTLVPILRTGDSLDGMKVLEYDTGLDGLDPSGTSAVAGGPLAWDDARRLTIRAVVKDGNGQKRAALYAVRVGTACAPDLDGSGALDLFDFLAFNNLFNAGDPGADFTADGELDLFDFLAFVNAFNAGC